MHVNNGRHGCPQRLHRAGVHHHMIWCMTSKVLVGGPGIPSLRVFLPSFLSAPRPGSCSTD